ncbi:MAG: hypothetical protein RLZZ360_797 [Candidatus Parcubacteria bacterium]|jgi:hypothetical protein
MDTLRYIAGGALAVVLLVTSTPTADAYTTYNSNAAQIAELQATILRLQAQLDALRGYSNNNGWSNSGSGMVTTGSAVHRGNGDVDFHGSARPGTTQSKVWFEFGPNRSLSYSTPKLSLGNSNNNTRNFTGYAYDLSRGTYYYRAVLEDRRGDTYEGSVQSINVGGSSYNNYDDDWYDNDDDDWNDDDEDIPDVTTDDVDDVTETRAELRGEVDMQDAEDGIVFFVFGEDEDQVEDAADEDRYSDIDTDNDDLQKVKVASNFDDEDDFYAVVTGLQDDTDHYFRICVEFEDEDNDERLECGEVEEFTTDEY